MTIAKSVQLDEPLIIDNISKGITVLSLNRPASGNSLSTSLIALLKSQLDLIAQDKSIRVVIISAQGNVFCSGHDLKELRSKTGKEDYDKVFSQCSNLMLTIQKQPQPVIAQVQGIATAAGCQLVATCDLAIAASEALFATPGVNIGLFCSTPMVAISRVIGTKQTMEMLLTGEPIAAEKALQAGLINCVVEQENLQKTTLIYAQKIAEKPPEIVRLGKKAFYQQVQLPIGQAYLQASKIMTENMMKREAQEGIDAFLRKQPTQRSNH